MNTQPFPDLEKRQVLQLINAFIEGGQLKSKMESRT